MDAVKFIKEYQRMCDKISCHNCLAFDKLDCCDLDTNNPELLVQIVEQWSKEHPQKTMMQDFFEKFPNAPKNLDNTPKFCPRFIGYSQFKDYTDCTNNYLKCWNRPKEE